MNTKTTGALFSVLAFFAVVLFFRTDKIPPVVRRLAISQQVNENSLLPQALIDQFCGLPLRSLFLGAGEASGEYLENKRDAYPNKIQDKCNEYIDRDYSQNITNLAIPYSTANDVAKCTHHIIGDDYYDVILIDYFRSDMGIPEYEGLEKLAERLRNRFPCATLIFLRPWYQNYIGYSDSNGWTSISDWAKNKGLSYENTNQELQASTEDWGILPVTENNQAYQAAVRDQLGWALYKDARDFAQWEANDCKKAFDRRKVLYNSFYYNDVYGHLDIARGVIQAAIYAKAERCSDNDINLWDDDDVSCEGS